MTIDYKVLDEINRCANLKKEGKEYKLDEKLAAERDIDKEWFERMVNDFAKPEQESEFSTKLKARLKARHDNPTSP